ncbi:MULTISPECIES: ATP-dependent helicase [Bifidobacterium]|uniref:ATP-dependent helicase n=1 Tax=Bifidobacterium TaxID=1678 RepID=UPI0005C4D6B0|nr:MULTISPECIES: ATP-dependent helicase [Bifidobacterium]TPF77346.1 DNA helicase II [Bifidobacterium sp. UTCIF-1]TPF79318.1 DNA helicase II [Bifidobacterium sp. UTCIF-24]TPF81865.1 DNA helicase II [Bifidobacterium sp. UTCIF-3]TPF83458.1 DNA helicase II [Bifidobacterium sp. UTCIF-36]TPF89696.1 DNA helicase II [Bifidobacterium sp. UTBIF-56]
MEHAQRILEGLDERQRTAATTLNGPVRIIAGAGAGKTRTVTRRIAYACATGAWRPERTLAVTFSVKAAAEMRARLHQLGLAGASAHGGRPGSPDAAGVTAATFHSAALHQLNSVWADVCEAPFPHLIEDQRDVASRAITRVTANADTDPITVRDVLAEINWAKVSLVAPEDYGRVSVAAKRMPPAGLSPQRFVDIYAAYEREKTSRGEIDFDDILLLVCHIMDDFPEAAAQIRSTIGWLTVDEYQDVSPLQHRLMMLWLGGGGAEGKAALNRNVCVVGDPAQTIYSFAGASSWDLLRFSDEFGPLAADVDLNTDYRSTPEVVSLANAVLAAAPNRQDYLRLVSARDSGAKVSRTAYDTDLEEAQGVAARIDRLVRNGAKPSDCAILTRINAQQPVFGAALRQYGLRFRVRKDSGWQTSALSTDAASRQALLEAMGLDGAGDVAKDDPGVTISTIHAAKGLEFDHVFLVGCSEGLLPYGAPDWGELLEEERRLMYVAITRAQDSLHLSFARTKDGYGAQQRRPSRFL